MMLMLIYTFEISDNYVNTNIISYPSTILSQFGFFSRPANPNGKDSFIKKIAHKTIACNDLLDTGENFSWVQKNKRMLSRFNLLKVVIS